MQSRKQLMQSKETTIAKQETFICEHWVIALSGDAIAWFCIVQ